ncbi:hypothetical protein RN001_010191 [Aquatica leii]|uniref:Helix-turn-helix domain-containing protein n=1 Tax=Aquatica leii TaxID=1421715 RepID=A0AAN7Q316_9COLE|nr:hypothetical protein RN001_010191 [Aquatica leii]
MVHDTYTDRYLNGLSHHHSTQKLSVVNSLVYRAVSLSQPQNLQEELNHLINVLRSRRSQKTASVDILFDETMIPTVSQNNFLGNDANKNCFIGMLKTKFKADNFIVKQVTEDADTLIINTALSVSPAFDNVNVVGKDINLLILLIALSTRYVYILKTRKRKKLQQIYSTESIVDKIAANHILFLHAFSSCDTTCALFNQGKMKFINVLQKIQI